MKKILIALLFVQPLYAQLEDELGKTAEELSGVTADNVTDFDKAFVNDVLFQRIADLVLSLQDYGQAMDNYADKATSITDTEDKSGLIWVPFNSDFKDTSLSLSGTDSVVLVNLTTLGQLVLASGINDAPLSVSGFVDRTDFKYFHAISFFPNGSASLDTLNSRYEVIRFSDSDSALNEWKVPPWFTSFDSIVATISCDSTDGDSAAFDLKWNDVAYGSDRDASLTAISLSDTADLGTAGEELIRLKFSGILKAGSQPTANNFLTFAIKRDGSISDNQTGEVNLHDVTIYYH
jgi:hypothetical protein